MRYQCTCTFCTHSYYIYANIRVVTLWSYFTAISLQKGSPKSYVLLLSNDSKDSLWRTLPGQHWSLEAIEQFGALYMHSPDDGYPTWLGFEPWTSEFRATTRPNEPTGQRYHGNKLDRCWTDVRIILVYHLPRCTTLKQHYTTHRVFWNISV